MDLDQKKWANKAVETNNTILDVRTPEEIHLCPKFNHTIKKIAITYIVNQGLEVHKPVR